jgi:hypothetical protein
MRKRTNREEPVSRQVPAAAACAEPDDVSEHRLERDVQRWLLNQPGLQFSSLVIRRVQNGVCLEGVLETTEPDADICSMVRRVAGVSEVLNHLVVRQLPQKG